MTQTISKNGGLFAYKRLLASTAPYWMLFAIGLIATAMNSGIDATLIWSLKPIINKGFIAHDHAFLTRFLPIGIIVIFVLRGSSGFLSDYCIARVGRNVVMDFRQKVFAHYLKLPASFFDKHTSGQLLSTIIYNVEQVAQATTDALLMVVQEGFLAIGLVIAMFAGSWQLTLLFLVSAPLIALIFVFSSRRMRKLSTNLQDNMAQVTHVAEESIEGYKAIRTFGGEQYEMNKFNRVTRQNQQREMKVIVTDSLGTSGVQLVASVFIAVILLIATSSMLNVTAGGFVAMLGATLGLLRPIRRLTGVNNKIQKGIAGAQSIFDLLDMEPEKDTGSKSLIRTSGHMEYRDVVFNYSTTKKDVLKHVSFSVQPGEVIALVGKSGSGKSTLVNLLPRFYDVQQGSILMDGIDIRDYRLADLRNQFALVSQHVTLFNDTIARNIAYGRSSEVSEAEIIRAAEAAHAMEFIKHLPDGLNSLVGENGVLLSGGQRQRIAIARAILKNAPILILDEATSALDTESERHIQAAFEELMRDRTTLVIAHRLSTIENANRIVVMDHGRIIEIGTHQQLLSLKGQYAKLYAMQFKEEKVEVRIEDRGLRMAELQ